MSPFARRLTCTVALAAFAAGAMSIQPARAAGGQGHLQSMSFNAESANTTVRVISTDGQTWNKIKPGPVQFWGHMKADMLWPGYVHEAGVVLGSCGGGLCASFPKIWFAQPGVRDYNHQRNFSFDASAIPVSGPGIPLLPYGDQILSRCNQHLQADGPTKSHSFSYEMHATFVVDTETVWDLDNAIWEVNGGDGVSYPDDTDHTRSDTFSVNVVCEPVIKPATNDVAFDHGEHDVENVKLFLTTYQNQIPGSNPGSVCPSLKVTARAETNQAGPVAMRLWEQKGGGAITQEFKEMWASYDAAKNGYFATWEKFVNVGVTSTYQSKVEIVDGTPFAPFDGWKDITVHCTNPGGGGFAPQPQNDPDNPPPQASWEGEVIVADSAGYKKQCPRKGQVFFGATRAAPGNFEYKLSCNNGASFGGTATAYDQGSGVFEAYGAHDLSINRTRTIQCTLQEVKENGTRVTIATDSHDFTCANRTFDDLPGDVVGEVPQNPSRPTVPAVIVTPNPKPICGPRQVLLRGSCVDKPDVSILCAPGFELKGKKCIRKPVIVAECKRGETRINGKCVKKPGVSILCAPGFELKGKKCIRKPVIVAQCKRGETRLNGKCIKKPEVSILCKPGFKLVGKKCVRSPVVQVSCKRGEKLVRGNCVKQQVAKPLKRLEIRKPQRVQQLRLQKPARAQMRQLQRAKPIKRRFN